MACDLISSLKLNALIALRITKNNSFVGDVNDLGLIMETTNTAGILIVLTLIPPIRYFRLAL
jgi:hypothetical protein